MTNDSIIKTCREILSNHEARLIDNQWVDVQTANAIVTVYEALNKENKVKFLGFGLMRMADVAWKLVSKGA